MVLSVSSTGCTAAGKLSQGSLKPIVAVVANAQQLQIGIAQAFHQSLVPAGLRLHVRGGTVGQMGAPLGRFTWLNRCFSIKVPVALGVVPGEAAVLVQVHRAHLGEIQPAGPVGLHQLFIGADGAGARGQAQHAPGLQQHLGADNPRGQGAHFLVEFFASRILMLPHRILSRGGQAAVAFPIPSYPRAGKSPAGNVILIVLSASFGAAGPAPPQRTPRRSPPAPGGTGAAPAAPSPPAPRTPIPG